MPTTEHGWPYPSPLDARNVPDDLQALAVMGDKHGVYYASGATDRDARFAGLPAGALVSIASTGELWQKTSDTLASWLNIYSDTGWLTTGFTVSDDWNLEGGYLKGRRCGSHVELRADMTYSGDADLTANSFGGLNDLTIITVPRSLAPEETVVAFAIARTAAGGVLMYKSGRVLLTDLHPNSVITNGDSLKVSMTYLAG